jgi:pimeloyl-ACP methyl ester carboxylesterase
MRFSKTTHGLLDTPDSQGSFLETGYKPNSATSIPRSCSSFTTFDDNGEHRRLLVIYIYGFIGNNDSFQFFPLHVHRLLQRRLAGTHRVYSKIYPRYKTYRAFHVARDDFSEWLALHESPSTDVVLVGHSMGGLLAADVVLMVGIVV